MQVLSWEMRAGLVVAASRSRAAAPAPHGPLLQASHAFVHSRVREGVGFLIVAAHDVSYGEPV